MLGDWPAASSSTPVNLYKDFKNLRFLDFLNSSTCSKMFPTAFIILLVLSNSDFALVSAQSEKELLLELRSNLTYDLSASRKLVHWDESPDFCRWAGVECGSNGRVSGLDLSEESIYDGINGAGSSLFRLTNLQSLNLAQNGLSPIEFPLGFGQLTELRYLNLSSSGFSGQVMSDLSNLTRLVTLDLSVTSSSLSLPNLQGLIHNLTTLRELYLDGVNVSANGNEWGRAVSSSLPNLRVLSMSGSFLTGPFDPSLQKLGSLSVIRLDGNNFSSPFPEFFAEFPNLEVLTLSSSVLSGTIPAKLFEIKSMKKIHLSENDDLGGHFLEFPVNGSLEELIIGGPKFSGILPESIGNLRMLHELHVTGSNISGPIPSTIKNLGSLVVLNLAMNRFSGPIPSFASLKNLARIELNGNRLTGKIPDSLWLGLDNLVSLSLRENSLEGEIPPSLFLLPSLEELLLSNNSFSGALEASEIPLSLLRTLDLSLNGIEGLIPSFLFELRNLSTLDLSWNKFSGPLELADFLKLASLTDLDLSYNDLSVHVDETASFSSWLPHLGTLKLASCKLQKLPNVANHSFLAMLDLSRNDLGGEVPNWMWGGDLRFLNLSHNQFTHFQEPYNLRRLDYLNLHSNMFVGEIPSPLTSAAVLDFSNNSFSSVSPDIGDSLLRTKFFSAADNRIRGSIPSSFCNATGLEVFDLSNNGFHGEIPPCLVNTTTLKVLNLRRNNLDGEIPDAFPVDCSLETLDLSRNLLKKLPKSLTRCSKLELLDLTKNEVNDTFPCWLDALSKLRVLVLRSNNLHGSMSCLGEANPWQDLQIMDFASNNISGPLPPKIFEKLHAFTIDGEEQELDYLHFSKQTVLGVYYQDSVTVSMKGQTYNLSKIQTVFTSIDFSDNHLEGEIPETVGELKSLYLLNFSHNSLSGQIPPSMARASKLQSIDLSFNGLDGEIPSQLASGLTSLAVLNVSYNHLVGRIPAGSQFQTFSESSYVGNDGLCGFPVSRNCSDEGETVGDQEEEREGEFEEWEVYVSAALGFGVGLGFIVVPVLVCKRWRSYYNRNLDRIVALLLGRKNGNLLGNEDW